MNPATRERLDSHEITLSANLDAQQHELSKPEPVGASLRIPTRLQGLSAFLLLLLPHHHG
jgi:hypothetical protein